jgi:N-acylneuraminate cytidylyltransferase
LGTHPLLAWSIQACLRSKLIDRTIVSTDSEEYQTLATQLGAEAPFLRPAAISQDRSTDLEFVLHALDALAAEGAEPDFIVHIRPTTPFRDPALIDEAITAFKASSSATALRSIHEMSESAYKSFEIAPTGQLKRVGSDSTELDAANNARQQFPPTYTPNGYVDVLSTAFIRSKTLLHGNSVMPFITPVVTEVDTEDDFMHLEYQLAKSPEVGSRLFDKV